MAKLIAIIVTYNGDVDTVSNIEKVSKLVDFLYVIDNGSNEWFLEVLKPLSCIDNVLIDYLVDNLGVAYALNKGVKHAKDNGFQWVVTLDQDSLPSPSMIHSYWQQLDLDDSIKVLSPNVCLENVACNNHHAHKVVSMAITSGMMINVSVFDSVGLFDEALFIDYVDIEFCIRLRNSKIKIIQVADAFLKHRLGEPHSVPWPFSVLYTKHNPLRRYYMQRNLLYVVSRYWRTNFTYCLKILIINAVFLSIVMVFGPSRLLVLKACVLAISDFIGGRFGKVSNPNFLRGLK